MLNLQAFKGMGKMTKEMKALQSAIVEDEIPEDWRQWCPPTNKTLSSWLRQLQKRFQQYYDWVKAKDEERQTRALIGKQNF
jgi:hypothetical protein